MRLCAFPLVKERRLESLNTLATLRWSIRFVRATGPSSTGLSNVTTDALTVRIVVCNLSTLYLSLIVLIAQSHVPLEGARILVKRI